MNRNGIPKGELCEKPAHPCRMAVETAPGAMIMVDAQGSIALANHAAEMLFGYNREKLAGKSVETIIPGRFRSRHGNLCPEYISAPEARAMGSGRDLTALHRNGSEIQVKIGLNPVKMLTGDFVLVAVIDLTDRKRAEIRMKAQAANLEKVNKQLEELVTVDPLTRHQRFE